MMKKWFGVVIVIYILGAIFLIINEKEKISTVNMFTFKENHSRVITSSSEVFDIYLYIDSNQSFFTEEENIISTNLKDEHNQLAVNISDISQLEQSITYQEKDYYVYEIDVMFHDVFFEGSFFEFTNAYLEITYSNNEILTLELGNVNFLFHEINQLTHLDLNRLYGVFNEFDGKEYIAGIVFEVTPLTNGPITIKNITCNLQNIYLDSALYNNVLIPPSNNIQVSIILDDASYSPIETSFIESQINLSVNDTIMLFIPMKYLNTIQIVRRFPIIISYEYFDVKYEFVIDDFLFYQTYSFQEVTENDIARVEYYY